MQSYNRGQSLHMPYSSTPSHNFMYLPGTIHGNEAWPQMISQCLIVTTIQQCDFKQLCNLYLDIYEVNGSFSIQQSDWSEGIQVDIWNIVIWLYFQLYQSVDSSTYDFCLRCFAIGSFFDNIRCCLFLPLFVVWYIRG